MNRHRRRSFGRWVALAFALLALSATAPRVRADAYEGFDYPVGPPQNVGLGVTGSTWRGGSGFREGGTFFTPTGWDDWFVTSAAGSLSDPTGTLATTGNHMETGSQSGGSVGRRIEQTLGTPGTDVWLSWLQRSSTAQINYQGLIFEQPFGDNGLSGLYFVGEPGSGPGDGTYVIGTAGQDDTVVSSGVPLVPNQTAFLVVHLQFQEGNDLATLYVNPTPGAATPTGGVTYSGLDMPIMSPRLELNGSSGTRPNPVFAFDELRVGDSYAEVAPPVPEPRLAVVAGGFLALILARRGNRGAFRGIRDVQ
jgi:hypothetical protein